MFPIEARIRLSRGFCWNQDDELVELRFPNGPKYWDPLSEEPSLFLLFAALGDSRDSIEEFASKYGSIANPCGLSSSEGMPRMSLRDWQKTIGEFRGYVSVLKAIGEGTAGEDEIERLTRTLHRRRYKDYVFSDPRDDAVVPLNFEVVAEGKRIRAFHRVDDLISAMEIQLIAALVNGTHFRECSQCGKPFLLTPDLNRSDKQFCSVNCRTLAGYHRKRQALEMRAQGKTLRQISRETGASLETLKRWFKQ